jgi:hypothetical protein
LIGVVLSGLSFIITRSRMILNVLGGVFVILGSLLMVGVIAVGGLLAGLVGESMVLTYGAGLGFLSGILLIVAGVLHRTELRRDEEIRGTTTKTEVPTPLATKYCVHCGSSMFSDGIFCPRCGKEQS